MATGTLDEKKAAASVIGKAQQNGQVRDGKPFVGAIPQANEQPAEMEAADGRTRTVYPGKYQYKLKRVERMEAEAARHSMILGRYVDRSRLGGKVVVAFSVEDMRLREEQERVR